MDDAEEDNTEVDQNDCYQEQGLEPALSSSPTFITHNNVHILNDHYTYQHCHYRHNIFNNIAIDQSIPSWSSTWSDHSDIHFSEELDKDENNMPFLLLEERDRVVYDFLPFIAPVGQHQQR